MLNKLKSIEQKLSPGLRRVLSNMGWLFSERVLNIILSLFVGLYVIAYLGPNNFGKLSYCISFVGLFLAIANLGLDQIIIRSLVKEEKASQEILGTAFILKFLGASISFVLIACAIWFLSNDAQTRSMTLIIALGLLFNSFDTIDFWFQSQVLSGPMAIVRSTQMIVSAGAKLLFISCQFPVIAFAYLMVADVALRAVGMIWAYLQQHRSIWQWQFNLARAIELLKDSWPLILSGVMVTIYMKIDQVMLGNMSTNEQVGNYAAAVRFSELWYFIPSAICSSVFPSIVRSKQKSQQEYYQRLQQLYDAMAWLSFAVAIPMTFASQLIVHLLIGSEYKQAGEILALHIWAGLFVFLGLALSQWLMAENYTQFSFISTSLGAIANVILNYLLIPEYGGVGAALATVISYAIACYLLCLIYPPMWKTGWMLTKALFIPLRFRQNFIYLSQFKKIIT